MSKLLFIEKETDTRAKITAIHSQPNLLPQNKKSNGIYIENMPEKPNTSRGQRALPYVNPQTREVWYEVVDKELSTEEQLLERMEKIEDKLDKLLMMR